ncbi:hypothetical protein [Afifella sp. YEN Y35]|uniref:hypothetical protein n=1 Tax=Afifella sp. YEN Y35 TaxID=3388337 RepID=UPI0039E0AAF7
MADDSSTESRAEANEVAQALGIAMAQWGVVENRLFLLYLVLCGAGQPPNTASVTYETLVHLDTKLNVIDRLMKFRSNEAVTLEEWASLLNKVRRKIKKVRNKIAHWRIWRNTEKGRAFLGPPLFVHPDQVPDFGSPQSGAMTAHDLLDHADRFTELADQIEKFMKNMRLQHI